MIGGDNMANITVVELFAVIVAVAGLMLTVLRISDMVNARHQQRRTAETKDIMDKLDEIQTEQLELKQEVSAVMSLSITMAEELEYNGKVNGATKDKLSKIKEQLYNK